MGQSFEVRVTTATSPFGAGVLTGLTVNFDGHAPSAPETPRAAWISRTDALQRTGAAAEAMGAHIMLACSAVCAPYWRVSFQSGRHVTINAITGAIDSDLNRSSFVGPVRIQAWRPGDTMVNTTALRNANVIGSGGTSIGQTNFFDGTHSFTGSTPVWIGLNGAMGSSNPSALRRVSRMALMSGSWVDVPLLQSWTPSVDGGASDLSNLWSPNTGAVSFPNATALLYGMFSYWTALTESMTFEGAGRFAFVVNSSTSPGIACGVTQTGDFGSPDANGNVTWSTITCSSDSTDNVDAVNHVTNGDMLFTSAHEFGHTINDCASVPGTGCNDISPTELPAVARPTNPLDWRFEIDDAENEVVPTLIANLLTGYRYTSSRDGVGFTSGWNYISYYSTIDSFGTPGQGGPVGNCLAGTICPSGYVCVPTAASYYTAGSTTAGLCTKDCTSSASLCDPGTQCVTNLSGITVPSGRNVCWVNQYFNQFWDSMGDRLVYTTGWSNALSLTMNAVSGQSGNAVRDIVEGADNYYNRYLQSWGSRFEVTRAFQAVYRGTALVIGDDFPDFFERAVPISIRSNNWTPIWWGHGQAQYPRFEDYLDSEVVMFRGVKDSSYEITAAFRGVSGSPRITVMRLSDPSSTSSSSWTTLSGSLTTPGMPETDWYVIRFSGPGATVDWQGQVRLAATSDDFSALLSEAFPMVHDVSESARLSSTTDGDAFQIHVPTAGTSLTINATNISGVSSLYVWVYRPDGTYYTFATLNSSSPNLVIPNVPDAGHWRWLIQGSSAGTYTTRANLGCGGGSPGCDTAPGTRTARYPWGDRFAARIPNNTTEHVYKITLQEYQDVSVSLADNSPSCLAEIRVFAPGGPTGQRHFGGQPVLQWTDGAATTDVNGNSPGVGGHFQALTGGEYEVRVRAPINGACPYYRLQLATTPLRGPAMPAW